MSKQKDGRREFMQFLTMLLTFLTGVVNMVTGVLNFGIARRMQPKTARIVKIEGHIHGKAGVEATVVFMAGTGHIKMTGGNSTLSV